MTDHNPYKPIDRQDVDEVEEDDSLCGNPENHDGGETDGCIECGMIRKNL